MLFSSARTRRESKFSQSATFVDIVVIDPSLDVGAIGEATDAFFFFEFGAACVAPAAFNDEIVPELDFLVGRSAELLKTPFQNFFVCATVASPFD